MKRRFHLVALSLALVVFALPPSTAAEAAPILTASAICSPDVYTPSKGCIEGGILLGPSTVTTELALECRTERFGVCRQWLIAEDRIGGLGFTRQNPKKRQSLVSYCAVPDVRYFSFNPAAIELDGDCDKIPDRSDFSLTVDSVKYVGSIGYGPSLYNVTVVDPKGPGFITVYPCDTAVPTSSTQNFAAGQTIASLVTLSSYDTLCVYSSERADYIVDYLGRSFVAPLRPTRVLDTRDGIGTMKQQVTAGQTLTMNVKDKPGLVGYTLTAVAINVTAVDPVSAGFVTVYPCDQARPQASNLNFAAGQTIANFAIVSPSASGDVCLFSSATADLLVDLSGYIAFNVPTNNPWTPERVLDTRSASGPKAAGTTAVKVAGTSRIAPDAGSVIANLTVVNPSADGFVTAYSCGGAVPAISNLNFRSGQTIANLATVTPDGNGNICLFSSVAVDLLLDVSGFFDQAIRSQNPGPIRMVDSRDFGPTDYNPDGLQYRQPGRVRL
jgi:hypothetical protein